MKISPRYDTEPMIRLDGPAGSIGPPLLRQRRRFAEALASMSPADWEAPSRCEGWRTQDVVAHLTDTDRFWQHTITSGLAGEPTRVLADFDPKATPAFLVDAVRDTAVADTLAAYLEINDALCDTVGSLDDEGWEAIGESPAGHVTISSLAHHALWDSWVHERDVLLPLGVAPAEEADEILACLRYAAALGPALALQSAPQRTGAVAIVVERPEARIVVNVDGDVRVADGDAPDDALELRGDAVEVLEALSVRTPWPHTIPGDKVWLLSGLTDVFESAPPS